jgi:hypothetical protein
MIFRLILLSCLTLFPSAALAGDLLFRSGPARNALIELYTSEGCSSCPPAEAWLNRRTGDDGLWRDFVPVAFHVDYWNYLGWTDRFSQPGYGQRQRDYARVLGQRTVYTPAFLVNGRPWRPGLPGGIPVDKADSPGRLTVELHGHRVSARFKSGSRPGPLVLNLALLGMGLSSDIRAGENSGRHARHDFVALAHARLPGRNGKWETTLPRSRDHEARRYALAAWISRPGDPSPLQATGGYLPGGLVGSP